MFRAEPSQDALSCRVLSGEENMHLDNPVLWLVMLAIWVALLTFATLELFAISGDCVSLEISGHSSGVGLHHIDATGANISINHTEDNSSWNMTAVESRIDE